MWRGKKTEQKKCKGERKERMQRESEGEGGNGRERRRGVAGRGFFLIF